MRRRVIFQIVFVLAGVLAALLLFDSTRVNACAPPNFPMPEAVRSLLVGAGAHGISDDEALFLQSYITDRDRYLELFEKLNPCPLYNMEKTAGGVAVIGLAPKDRKRMQEELHNLELKWAADTEQVGGESLYNPEFSNGSYSVPAEERLIHFE